MSPYVRRIALFLFGSGFCALVYQLAWLRLLRLVFGSSTWASAAVLAIFMGGLGLGGYLLGRRGDRAASPLGLYAGLEIGISLAAALSVPLIAGIRALYIAVGGSGELGIVAASSLRLLLAAVVLAVPTFLMGGTLPAAVRAVTRAADSGRHAVGLLYAINTLGAVCGAMLTTFVLIELLGIRQTIWLACLLNLLIALTARSLARRQGMLEPPPAASGETGPPPPAGERPRAPVRLVLAAACVVGFVFFLMELVWYRMMAPILGGSTYTFGVVLGVALLGIGAGGLLYGVSAAARRPGALRFAATCALEALFLALPFAVGDRIAFAAHELRGLEAAGFPALAMGWTVVTAFVVLPAAVVAGYQFPVLVALLGAGRRDVARQVGLAYAWNTIGAILGALAGGFLLLPGLTAPTSWRLAVWLLLALAAVFLVVDGRRAGWAARLAPTAAAALALIMTLATGPSAFWRHSGIGAGRLKASPASPNELRDLMASRRRAVEWEIEGRESSVALIRSSGYSFLVNGKSDGSARLDAPTQVMSPLVGAILHPEPADALVIGLGTGSSAGWLAAVSGLRHVDVVELEPAIRRVAEDCAPVNRGVLDLDGVRLVIADGREYLLTADRQWDLIFSEPSNPYRAGIASLFTREFYQAVADGLRQRGIFLQWLQAYEIDAQVVRTAYATLSAIFPHVETWQVHARDLLLVASNEPIEHDLRRIARRVGEEPFRTALQSVWGVSGIAGLYSGYVANPAFAAAVAEIEGDWLNTDDRPIIEFGFARHVGRIGSFEIARLRELANLRGQGRPTVVGGELDWRQIEEAREARGVIFDSAPAPLQDGRTEREARSRARLAYLRGDLAAAHEAWAAQTGEPTDRIDLVLAAESLAEAGDDRAPEMARRLRRLQPVEAAAAMARWHYRRGRRGDAADELVAAQRTYESDPWPWPPVMRRALELAREIGERDAASGRRLLDQLERPFVLRLLEETRLLIRVNLARKIDFAGRCVAAFEELEPHVPWSESFLRRRLDCYGRNRHPLVARARRQLDDYRALADIEIWWGLLPGRADDPAELALPELGDATR
jgi:spermidine synthase